MPESAPGSGLSWPRSPSTTATNCGSTTGAATWRNGSPAASESPIGDAHRWVHAAHALKQLPCLSKALETGRLCLDKVVELARFATVDTEDKLITWAARVTVAAVRHKADLAVKTSLEEVRDVQRTRYLRWWWYENDSRLAFDGDLPAAEGAVLVKALERVADTIPRSPEDWDALENPRLAAQYDFERRCADALYVLAGQKIANDSDVDRATVVVYTQLSGVVEDHGSEIEGGPVIHPEIARRLSCDGRLQFVLTDPERKELGIGETSQAVPRWLRRALMFRDGGCTFPGCHTRAYLRAHHIWHWEHGGPTELWNLVLVCHFHHKLVHEFRWKVQLDGSLTRWFKPDGTAYDPSRAPPVRHSV